MNHEVFYDATGGFSNADKSVISWEGSNYYRACDEPVVSNEGGVSGCVKRVDHPGDVHEDFDGNRKTIDKGRMAVVVTFTLDGNTEVGFRNAQAILAQLKPMFADQENVLVYGAIREKADQIIMFLDGDG